MNIKGLSRILLLICCFTGYAQSPFSQDISFVRHLEQIAQYKEALYYLDQISPKYASRQKMDTLSFFKGKYHYQLKQLDQSISWFQNVSPEIEEMWEISQFYLSFQQAYTRQYDAAAATLKRADFSDSLEQELKAFQLASIHLLKRDFEAFDAYTSEFSYDYYLFSDYEKDMIGIAGDIRKQKKKSPLMAAVLSALVPGAGKYYLGKIGQGTMSLVGTGILGLQAYEGYRKDGVKSPRFIIFGSLFSVFYVANIWGSAVAVRVTREQYNQSADEAIFINMHLPLRVLYQ